MAHIDIMQAEADALIAMEKHCVETKAGCSRQPARGLGSL
jgi:hypothetical protein